MYILSISLGCIIFVLSFRQTPSLSPSLLASPFLSNVRFQYPLQLFLITVDYHTSLRLQMTFTYDEKARNLLPNHRALNTYIYEYLNEEITTGQCTNGGKVTETEHVDTAPNTHPKKMFTQVEKTDFKDFRSKIKIHFTNQVFCCPYIIQWRTKEFIALWITQSFLHILNHWASPHGLCVFCWQYVEKWMNFLHILSD